MFDAINVEPDAFDAVVLLLEGGGERVVGAEYLEKTAVAAGTGVGSDDTVERTIALPPTREAYPYYHRASAGLVGGG